MAQVTLSNNNIYSQMKTRRLRLILGIIFGIVIIALLGTAIYFIVRGGDFDNNQPKPEENGIKLEDVLTGRLAPKRFNGSWSGSNLIYKEEHSIVEYDVKTKNREVLLLNGSQYVLFEKSADGQFLLLAKNYRKNFRYSFEAEYDIYNITSRAMNPLKIKGEQRSLIMAQWAPVGNGLVINFERNLYYKPNPFADEITITSDDNFAILNGVPDWVYEEEVFNSNVATWFNPNGTKIAFIKFDDSPTHTINFPYYGEAGDLRYQYPFNRLVAYPKAGSSNPRVSLFTADLESAVKGSEFLDPVPVPSALNTETDYIITVVDWLDNNNVLSVWMNRIQNLAYLQVVAGRKRLEVYDMESKTGWVDLFSTPFKNKDGTRIAVILPQGQDDDGYFRHLCILSATISKSSPDILTKGKYTVQSILHWDTTNDIIFYTANTEQNSEILQVYYIRATTGHTPKCLTCKLHTSGDVEQNYYSADFSTDHQIVISSLGPGIPMTAIYEWTYSNSQVTLKKVIDWENNESLRSKLKSVAIPTVIIDTIPIASGFTAKALMQLPPNLDRSGKTKYPMLVDVYGGPDSHSVVNKWILDWGTYLSSSHSVIYVKIDGRGTNLRGDKLLHSIYQKLGTVEITDQIDVTKKLQAKYSFIDANHTGIWGWSYGGYAAAMALANDDSLAFRCAASIAPVTDWAYYDSIYTERYMRLPNTNEAGYMNARLSTRAQKLRGKKFLLVHGTLDDNVHYQQAMILAKNLERYDILFKQISYPDEDHGLSGVRPHLYHSLDRFFGDCFDNKNMNGSK
ncbi:venom dipeptidyl peptidase 4-like [Teleopsis dalmanni]|uniref:venom dipeptidyl peptidase 4-like n=1 Tax=Teleopsis dalmanni TaxID=139649 RepID=UPI0018CD2A42|nr:venom dipeptidyl peptidase 4-like [Teleopsis dalmanni]